MIKSIELKETFLATPKEIFSAWLDSEKHTAMTGGTAICSTKINEEFSAWDGYISGKNISIIENKEIIQEWRTTEFKESDKNSELILKFQENERGCQITLIHNNIPEGQSDYEQGWIKHYFEPMKAFFKK
ncbi:MAG: activator of HSP90 ATPase [Psychroserpens sp.]|jgi:activator of HSP90 ATPase